MKLGSIIGVIFILGLFVILKIFEDSIPKITDPTANIIVLVGFVIFAIIYGVSQLRKSKAAKKK